MLSVSKREVRISIALFLGAILVSKASVLPWLAGYELSGEPIDAGEVKGGREMERVGAMKWESGMKGESGKEGGTKGDRGTGRVSGKLEGEKGESGIKWESGKGGGTGRVSEKREGGKGESGVSERGTRKVKRNSGNVTADGDLSDWGKEDMIGLDAVLVDRYDHNDGYGDSRDILAAYVAVEPEQVVFRIDLYDLAYGAEFGGLDIYVLIDVETGGQEHLPDMLDCQTDRPWEVAVALYDSEHYSIYYGDWSYHNTTFKGAYYHSQYDAVEFGLDKSALSDNGYAGGEMEFQFVTVKDGTDGGAGEIPGKADVTDALPNDLPWEDGVVNGGLSSDIIGTAGTAKLGIFHHGNQFIKNVSDFIRDGDGLGFRKVPEIHEKWDVPVNLHVSGTLAEGAQWFKPGFNRYLRSLVDRGIVHMVGGFYSEYIPQYVPEEVNLWSMGYARDMIAAYYNDTDVPLCWVPERVFWDGYEKLIRKGGYDAVMADTENAFTWYAEPEGYRNEHEVYREDNGLKILFVSNRGRAGAPRNVQNQIHNSHDGGLAYTLREMFSEMARDGEEQYALYMDDWEKTCGNIPLWGGQGVVDAYDDVIGWIALHPWIEVKPLEHFLRWDTAGEVDINDGSYFWLSGKTGSLNDKDNEGNLYDAWYYDPLNEVEHISYYDHVPADCEKEMGDLSTPDTIIGDTWGLIDRIPEESPFYDLAFKTFSNGLYETAWFEGEWPDIYIPYWQKEQAAHVRNAAIYYYAHRWYASSDEKEATAEARDLDLDGKDEYVLSNDEVFCVFEDTGGKLVAAFHSDGDQIVGNQPAGWLAEGDAVTDAVTTTTSNTHYDGEYLGVAESVGEEYLEGSKTFAFADMGYENEVYSARPDNNSHSITFERGEITKTFRLSGNSVIGRYDIGREPEGDMGMRFTFSPKLSVLMEKGREALKKIDEPSYVGWETEGVGGAVELDDDTEIIGTGSNVLTRYAELRALSRDLTVKLHISRLNTEDTNSPPGARLLAPKKGANINHTTPSLYWEGEDDEGNEIYYTVLLGTEPTPRDIAVKNTSSTQYNVTSDLGLDRNTTYYWTVTPNDAYGVGTCFSGVWYFNITEPGAPSHADENTLPTVEIVSPANGSEVRGNVTIRGRAYPGNDSRSAVRVEGKVGDGRWRGAEEVNRSNGELTWEWEIDTTLYFNGSLVLFFRAFDGALYSAPTPLVLIVAGSGDGDGVGDNGDGKNGEGANGEGEKGGSGSAGSLGPFLTRDGDLLVNAEATVRAKGEHPGERRASIDGEGYAHFSPPLPPGDYICKVKYLGRTVISPFNLTVNETGNVTYEGEELPPASELTREELGGFDDTEGSGSNVRSKICFNITFMFILPMLAIAGMGVLADTLLKRRRKKRGK